jgi:glycine cleavage system H protein
VYIKPNVLKGFCFQRLDMFRIGRPNRGSAFRARPTFPLTIRPKILFSKKIEVKIGDGHRADSKQQSRSVAMSVYPDDLYYTKEHEWARVAENIATVGISKYAVDQLGDITYVGLPREGEQFKKDDVFGTIESVKAQSDLFAPVSGTVIKMNDTLEDSPEYINEDPYDEGWLVQVEMESIQELEALMSAEEYAQFVAELEE